MILNRLLNLGDDSTKGSYVAFGPFPPGTLVRRVLLSFCGAGNLFPLAAEWDVFLAALVNLPPAYSALPLVATVRQFALEGEPLCGGIYSGVPGVIVDPPQSVVAYWDGVAAQLSAVWTGQQIELPLNVQFGSSRFLYVGLASHGNSGQGASVTVSVDALSHDGWRVG